MPSNRRTSKSIAVQSIGAFNSTQTLIQNLKEDLFRIIALPGGYYFCSWIDFSNLGTTEEVGIHTSMLDSVFKSLDSIEPGEFLNIEALQEFLTLRKDFEAWAPMYVTQKTDTYFKRDLESETKFKNFIQDKTEPVDPNNFKI